MIHLKEKNGCLVTVNWMWLMQCTNKFFPLLQLDFSVLKLIHVMWWKENLVLPVCKLCLTTLTSQTEIKNIRKLEFSWITKGTGPAPLVNRHSSQKGDYVAGILDSDTAYLIYSVNRIRSVYMSGTTLCSEKNKISRIFICALQSNFRVSWTRNLLFLNPKSLWPAFCER